MANTKRLALSLPDDLDLALTKLSQLTGQPKSSIITEILSDALPFIAQVTEAIVEAKEGQLHQAVQTTAKFLEEATLKINQSHLDLGSLKAKHGI